MESKHFTTFGPSSVFAMAYGAPLAFFFSSFSLLVASIIPGLVPVGVAEPRFYDPNRVTQLSWRPRCSYFSTIHSHRFFLAFLELKWSWVWAGSSCTGDFFPTRNVITPSSWLGDLPVEVPICVRLSAYYVDVECKQARNKDGEVDRGGQRVREEPDEQRADELRHVPTEASGTLRFLSLVHRLLIVCHEVKLGRACSCWLLGGSNCQNN
ncbi:hypothetical protein B296_00009326 [Ensete ventricosum]|uniref:Uncharacterized protein n=1 Tax=Ensete ventricosum TaxID=4639 RepID=A0A427AJF5_ENSVE|nr:hypothetical protein B296_00009326 [Ensete ventricosum]